MAQYFHAYRIDHILGFFRIWEIPGECLTATLGHFRPSIPLWRHELESRGLWDMDRLIKPYVRHHIIEELFGSLAVEVRPRGPSPSRAPAQGHLAESFLPRWTHTHTGFLFDISCLPRATSDKGIIYENGMVSVST